MLKELYFRGRRKVAHLFGDERAVVRWSNCLSSDRILAALKTGFDLDVPPSVNLEINTDCNYKCPFCPQSSFQRPVRHITREGFRRVLDELKAIDYAGLLVLSVNNEPFLHPLLLEFCRQVSEELSGATVSLISNGALIREEDIRGLAALARPPRITVDDYTPDHRIITRLQEWLDRLDPTKLCIEFQRRSWSEKISNRAGNQPGCTTVPDDYHDIVCAWPFGGLFLNPELQAFLCCSDYRYEMIVGDLNQQSLMEIWKGIALQRVRDAMRVPDRARIPLCARCDAEWWCLPEHCWRS